MFLKKSLCLALMLTLCACGGDYSYRPQTAQEVPAAAIYKSEAPGTAITGSKIVLTAINGESVSNRYLFLTFDSSEIMGNNRVLLTPGIVTLSYDADTESAGDLEFSFTFEAQPGETYAPQINNTAQADVPYITLVNKAGRPLAITPTSISRR